MTSSIDIDYAFLFSMIGQICTLVSYIIFWISRFFKTKKQMLFSDNISRVFAIIAFAFLGAWNGVEGTIFVFIRNTIGGKLITKSIREKQIAFTILLGILFIMYILSFDGIATVFICICNICNLIGVILCNEQHMRLFGIVGSALYIGYLFFSGNMTGVVCEIICLLSMLVSYIMYHVKNKL